ncbi:MAG: hypothetical protein ACI85I_000420 [Arenicella sp.]
MFTLTAQRTSFRLYSTASFEAFTNLKNTYTTTPEALHNPDNPWAVYTPMKQGSVIQTGDHMKITVTAFETPDVNINLIDLGPVSINETIPDAAMDIYVRFTDIKVTENSFEITAKTLYGHTDAGFIMFKGNYDAESNQIGFVIYNETTLNVGLDIFGFGRYAQTEQWEIVLNNVEKSLNGTTNSTLRL